MRRLIAGLIIVLACSGVAAEEIAAKKNPAKVGTAAGAAAKGKPAAKKAVPKGPPAKELFGAVTTPAPLEARSIGSYAKGCLAGGASLPINGPDWQVMRLSRNRNWGNPRLLDYLERLASDARALDGWPGLLVGDMSQPRGGPMINGHTSHQVGLDADLWLTPMPDHILTPEEREDMTAVSMLKDPFTVDPAVWTPLHVKLIKRAASYRQVERIFVHPAIKKKLCEDAGKDRAWLGKVRPWWNHHYHFHVRLSCPPGAAGCENQKSVNGDDGCGKELDNWYAMLRTAALASPKPPSPPSPNAKPWKGKPPLYMANLPAECKTVLTSGGNVPVADGSQVPAVLKAVASKEAGPPVPTLTPEQIAALKGSKGSTAPGVVPLPDRKPH
jgi:penicillin-insensitive murein endopeptidase